MKVYIIYMLSFLVSCGHEQKPNVARINSSFQVECDSLALTQNLVKTVFNDSTIVKLYSKVKDSKIVIKHQEVLSNNLSLELNGKRFNFQKFEDSESVDGTIDYSKFPNLFLTNGMCSKCDTSKINVVSIYFGIGVELTVKKDKCNWMIIEKFIYDT